MTVRRSWLFALASLSLACPNQEEVVPLIHVTPGAASRAWLMGRGKADPSASRIVHDTRISIMKKGEELGGPNAVGRPGDILLENDEVAFVIDQLGSGTGFELGGGNIVDAADASVRKDELGQLFTFFGDFPRQAIYEKISSDVKEGVGVVVCSGHELKDKSLAVTTVYSLRPNDRALLIETTLENEGSKPSDKLGLGDAIQWGGTDKFAPGKGLGFKGETTGVFLGGIGRYVSYALTSTNGVVDAVSGSSWSDTFQRKGVTIGPREKVHYSRVFIVGARPDTSSLVAELIKTAGGNIGELTVDLVDAKGKKVEPDPGAHVLLLQKGTEVLTIAATKSGIAAEIPPGEYDVVYGSGGGRKSEGQPVHVKLGANREASAKIVVSEGARVDLMCSSSTEPANAMPCKFSFDSLDGTAPVDFGPGGSAGPAKNQITTATGILHDFPISPGKYRVTASRGPEWDTVAKDIALAPGKSAEVHATLTRVVDTKGYLGCDFHQHSMLGADAPTSTRDRVISNVAEGVEVAVASEHNIVADFTPYVNELHLERELVEIPGDEITTDAALVPWGHMNVFPLHPDPTKPRDGAIDASLTPTQVIDLAAKIPYPHVVQINHPRAWNIGYFDLAKYDPKTGLAGAPWYDGRFDAVEVWNGRNIESRDKVRTDYFSLLMHGHPVTPTANTDTHGVIGQEAGYPRTFVRVDDDGPTTGWNDARSADLVKGIVERRDVVLTNGPFLKVDVNGVGIGAIAKGKHLLVHVVVQSAPWVTVDKIGLTFGSGASLERPLVTKLNGAGALEGVVDFQVASPKDDVVSVWVSGSKPMTPVLNGDPSEIMPYAMTGAIWIDADADGKTLGREAKPAAKK